MDWLGDNGGWWGYGLLVGNSFDVGLYFVSVGGNVDGKLSVMVVCVDVCSSWWLCRWRGDVNFCMDGKLFYIGLWKVYGEVS